MALDDFALQAGVLMTEVFLAIVLMSARQEPVFVAEITMPTGTTLEQCEAWVSRVDVYGEIQGVPWFAICRESDEAPI